MGKEKGTMSSLDSKRTAIGWGLTLALFLITPVNVSAFEQIANADGTICYYIINRNQVFYLNEKCSSDVSLSSCITAVENSIAAWTGYSCSDLQLELTGTTTDTETGSDFKNLIVWRESSNEQDPGYWEYESGVIAMTTTSFYSSTGQIFDADIEVNGVNNTFATNGSPSAMDIQNTLTHELGHCIGLKDLYGDSDVGATMYYNASVGETKKRTLSEDDINGLCTIYPTGEPTPLCSGQHRPSGGGGCMAHTVDFNDSLLAAFLLLMFWHLLGYLRRENRG